MAQQNIVITGEGIVSAIGVGKDAVAQSLRDRRTGIGPMRWLGARHTELPVGEVKLSDDDMKDRLAIPHDQDVSRTTLMGILAVREALHQAAVSPREKRRIVLVSGTTVAGMDVTEEKFSSMVSAAADNGLTADMAEGICRWLAHHDCGSCTGDIVAHFGGLFSDFTTISTACSSALNALMLGADMLKTGDADIVVAGGTEALSAFHLNGFNALMILDHDRCRPFDKDRAGLNLGEGAAYVVLEREDDARRRGAGVEAWVAGYGNACDAYHQTASSPDDTGAQMAMREALAMAGLKAADVDWIHAHGTGTPDNDRSESRAICAVFGDTVPPVSSTKGFTGHTTSASGSISAVISIIAMQQGFIPVNLGFSHAMDDGLAPVTDDIRTHLGHVMVNAFGFGGNDSSLILADSGSAANERWCGDEDIVEVARVENHGDDSLADIKRYVRPMEARRMGRLMKSALLTSLEALETAGVAMPDAIVTGTAYGSLEYSERLLRQLVAGDDMFKPTFFMQSTHNTVSSLIAIHLKCHGSNITISQGSRSMEWAVYQAKLLLRSGRCRSVLVGCHDESTELINTILAKAGRPTMPMVSSVAVVLRLRTEEDK